MNIVFLGKGQWKEGKGIVLLRKVSRVICIKVQYIAGDSTVRSQVFYLVTLQYIAK